MEITTIFLAVCSTISNVSINSNKGVEPEKSCFNCGIVHDYGDCIEGTKTIDLSQNTIINEPENTINNIISAASVSDSTNADYFTSIDFLTTDTDKGNYFNYPSNSQLIDDYEYFQNLRAFGQNANLSDKTESGEVAHFPDNFQFNTFIGVCGYVAVQMLLSYYNTYFSDNLIPQSNVVYGDTYVPFDYSNCNDSINGRPDFSPGSNHDFLRRLYNVGPSSDFLLDNPRAFQFPWLIPDIMGSWLLYMRNHFPDLDFLMSTVGMGGFSAAQRELIYGNLIGGSYFTAFSLLACNLVITDELRANTISEAKSKIDIGKPVILTFLNPNDIFGLSHVVVAYGYTDDGKFIVNTGWTPSSYNKIEYKNEKEGDMELVNKIHYPSETHGSLRISLISEEYLVSCTSLDISYSKINDSKHIYSYRPNFPYNQYSHTHLDGYNDFYCSCGKGVEESNPVSIPLTRYAGDGIYNSTEQSNALAIDEDNYLIKTLRFGYIYNKYNVLSAKRHNCGTAYIDIESSTYIRAISWFMALWSDNESLKLNSSIRLESFYNNTWVSEKEFDYDKLSTNKDDLFKYNYYFPTLIHCFRFVITTNDVENENNRGRMVFNNLTLFGGTYQYE